jgi:hypothetical protein
MGAMSGEWVVVASRVRQELVIEVVAEVVSELCGSFAAFFEVSTDCENQAEDTEETAEEEQVICKVDHCVLLCFFRSAEAVTAAARRDLSLPTRGKEADGKQLTVEKHCPGEGVFFRNLWIGCGHSGAGLHSLRQTLAGGSHGLFAWQISRKKMQVLRLTTHEHHLADEDPSAGTSVRAS